MYRFRDCMHYCLIRPVTCHATRLGRTSRADVADFFLLRPAKVADTCGVLGLLFRVLGFGFRWSGQACVTKVSGEESRKRMTSAPPNAFSGICS